MAQSKLTLHPGTVSLAELKKAWQGAAVTLAPAAYETAEASAASIGRILASGHTVYGVNTGFGLLANRSIPADQLALLQRNLVVSHACGLGPDLEPDIVRLILVLKIISLTRGASGVSRPVIDQLLAFLGRDLMPCIPAQGSVGASGDLAPLAHMSAAMIGVGRMRHKGKEMPAAEALAQAELKPLDLGPKEGLALLNGTQASTAIALDALFKAERIFHSALITGALSVDALKGSDTPFDPRIHAVRGQPGQIDTARTIRKLLQGSEIRASHVDCDKVQDPYSFRCQPQVMGAALDLMRHAARTLTIEANAASDNPLVFPETDDILSGGNFHAQPVAFAADMLTMALCETGSLSERRLAVLTDPKMSSLPPFLVENSGVNSGFMILQVTSAALVSENKTLAYPGSVDSIPTSAGQEDHVSMATAAAAKAGRVAGNTAGVVAIEWLAAAQGIDFHTDLKTSLTLQKAHALLRTQVPHTERDHYWADYLKAARDMVLDGTLAGIAEADILPLLIEESSPAKLQAVDTPKTPRG